MPYRTDNCEVVLSSTAELSDCPGPVTIKDADDVIHFLRIFINSKTPYRYTLISAGVLVSFLNIRWASRVSRNLDSIMAIVRLMIEDLCHSPDPLPESSNSKLYLELQSLNNLYSFLLCIVKFTGKTERLQELLAGVLTLNERIMTSVSLESYDMLKKARLDLRLLKTEDQIQPMRLIEDIADIPREFFDFLLRMPPLENIHTVPETCLSCNLAIISKDHDFAILLCGNFVCTWCIMTHAVDSNE